MVHATRGENTTSDNGVYPWYVVIVLMLAQTFSFIDRMIMGLLVQPIRTAFDISDTQFSLLAGFAFAVFYAVMGIPLARIADAHSRRGLIAAGIALWSVMTALCGLAKSYWWLFLARVGVGVGEAALSPAAYSLINDYFSKASLARALSVYTIGITLGSGLAYMVGGQVIAWAESVGEVDFGMLGFLEGWQLTFLMVGIPGLLVAGLMFTIKEPARKGLSQASQGVSIGETLRYLGEHKKAFLTHMLGMAIFIMVVYSLNVWGPSYLIRTFNMARTDAGLSFGAIIMVSGTAGLLTGGYFADKRFSRGEPIAYSRVILVSIMCALPFILLLGADIPRWLGMSSLFIALFFSSFQGGIAAGVVSLMAPATMRSQLVAIHFLLSNLLGLGLGPTVVAAITDYVFRSDVALGQSIALSACIMCPLAFIVLRSGTNEVERIIKIRMAEI